MVLLLESLGTEGFTAFVIVYANVGDFIDFGLVSTAIVELDVFELIFLLEIIVEILCYLVVF